MRQTALSHFDWPFFENSHRELAARVATWAATQEQSHGETDASCVRWVRALGAAGFLRYCVPEAEGGALPQIDSRSVCLLREQLAWYDGLADFALAMQGIGSGPISLGGTDTVRREWLPRVADGSAIAAFALTEPEAGSDAGALTTRATRVNGGWRIDGEKTWISNGGIASFYCVFARSDAESTGSRGVSAFLVPADTSGLTVAERLDVMAPHPLATLQLANCVVPDSHLLGVEGGGFKLAMRTLDIFRMSVAAASVGFARRALVETLQHASSRKMFGATLGALPLAEAMIGDMATELDAAALLTYRAAWYRDTQRGRATTVSAMAKSAATELAQRIIDRAVQLHGARGVQSGGVVERLYREIRALRIYEGATEVQRLLVGRETLRAANERSTTP